MADNTLNALVSRSSAQLSSVTKFIDHIRWSARREKRVGVKERERERERGGGGRHEKNLCSVQCLKLFSMGRERALDANFWRLKS